MPYLFNSQTKKVVNVPDRLVNQVLNDNPQKFSTRIIGGKMETIASGGMRPATDAEIEALHNEEAAEGVRFHKNERAAYERAQPQTKIIADAFKEIVSDLTERKPGRGKKQEAAE